MTEQTVRGRSRGGRAAREDAQPQQRDQPQQRAQPERAFTLAPPYTAGAALDDARFALRLTPSHDGLHIAGGTESGGAEATASSSATGLPEAFALEGAGPNPTRGATAVRYALPEAGAVELAVYDLLGRRVAVLAAGEREAGYHTVRWEASGVATGTYVVRLVAGGGAFTRTITVLR